MSTSPLSGISSTPSPTTTATTTATADPNALGENDFLKLLTAQLANQDPLQPVDNQAFIAQLAQFSSLQELQGVSSKLDGVLSAITASSQLDTASLVGKTVSYGSNGFDVAQGQPPPTLSATLASPATVTAVIQDASGATVRTIAAGAQGAGTFNLAWDGRDANGNAVPAGHYTVQLTATAPNGASVAVQPLTSGTVQGVDFSSGSAQLIVGGAHVNLSAVLAITQS